MVLLITLTVVTKARRFFTRAALASFKFATSFAFQIPVLENRKRYVPTQVRKIKQSYIAATFQR
jgi:hypothetical protein